MNNKLIFGLVAILLVGGLYLLVYNNLNTEPPPTPIPPPEKTMVKLYYYDAEKDKDESGNVQCSRQGLVPVEREMSKTDQLVENTIKLLIKGQLSDEEKAAGVSTEYPLAGFALTKSNLNNGTLTLEFTDSQNKTVGGSCRVGILWFQINETALQFSEVQAVKFLPEELFQP